MGSIAECGCYEGASTWFMAAEAPKAALHLFDSFQGLSAPQTVDHVEVNNVLPWKVADLASHPRSLRGT